jgi:hypothetical protein
MTFPHFYDQKAVTKADMLIKNSQQIKAPSTYQQLGYPQKQKNKPDTFFTPALVN